jgi:hypothetical protein
MQALPRIDPTRAKKQVAIAAIEKPGFSSSTPGLICTTLGDRMQAQESLMPWPEVEARLSTGQRARTISASSHRRFSGSPRVNLFKARLQGS